MRDHAPADGLLSAEAFATLREEFEQVGEAANAEDTDFPVQHASPAEFECFVDDDHLQIRGYGSEKERFPEFAVLFGIQNTRGVEPVLFGIGPADTLGDGTQSVSPEAAVEMLEGLRQLIRSSLEEE